MHTLAKRRRRRRGKNKTAHSRLSVILLFETWKKDIIYVRALGSMELRNIWENIDAYVG